MFISKPRLSPGELVAERSRNIQRLDPKAFFAAERTFLHYIQKALYLGGLCVALLSIGGGASERVGLLIGVFVLAMIVYAYVIYRERTDKISRRVTGGAWRAQLTGAESERLDSKWGPVVVFVLLMVVVVAAVFLNVEEGIPFVAKKSGIIRSLT
eukprot:GHVQ01013210.1.p1 GENE.GHVQ01013210.1~~GHVQ01013210.1.p1  ORF type:complete len:155 (+),score=20.07 GHVQ01013210.1:156-620(+)